MLNLLKPALLAVAALTLSPVASAADPKPAKPRLLENPGVAATFEDFRAKMTLPEEEPYSRQDAVRVYGPEIWNNVRLELRKAKKPGDETSELEALDARAEFLKLQMKKAIDLRSRRAQLLAMLPNNTMNGVHAALQAQLDKRESDYRDFFDHIAYSTTAEEVLSEDSHFNLFESQPEETWIRVLNAELNLISSMKEAHQKTETKPATIPAPEPLKQEPREPVIIDFATEPAT